jgi:hypothetical protein
MLRGYDFDGVVFGGDIDPVPPYIVVTGRVWDEWDDDLKTAAQYAPIYMRGIGRYRDHQHAGRFKAAIINLLGITEFYEDRDDQIAIIRAECPGCNVIKVG